MFDAECMECGVRVLLSSRRIERIERDDTGVVVVFRCWLGHLGRERMPRTPSGSVESAPLGVTRREEISEPAAFVGTGATR